MNQPPPALPLSRRSLLAGVGAIGALSALPAWAASASLAPAGAASWPGVSALMRRYVDGRKLPGIVSTFGWGEGGVEALALGSGNFGGDAAMGLDSLFRVYSMTKPVTGLLTAMLIDQGRLSLDTRLAEICPEFSAMQVAIDPKKSLEARPAAQAITIRHLLTHTAGLGYAGVQEDKPSLELLKRGVASGRVSHMHIPGITPPVPVPGPDEWLRRAAAVPLVAEPGTAWRYSMSLDVLGLVLQRLVGKPLAVQMAEQIFGPAGMDSSWFRLPAGQASRFTTNYGVVGRTALPIDRPAKSVFSDAAAFDFGGAGLVSSPRDYDRFMQLLLGDGRIAGRQLVSAAAVRMATSNLLPEGADTRGTFVAGAGFGAGGRVGLGADEGSFGWSGAAGTIFFVQRRIGLRAGLYAQFMPPEVYPLQREFLAAARADVIAKGKQ